MRARTRATQEAGGRGGNARAAQKRHAHLVTVLQRFQTTRKVRTANSEAAVGSLALPSLFPNCTLPDRCATPSRAAGAAQRLSGAWGEGKRSGAPAGEGAPRVPQSETKLCPQSGAFSCPVRGEARPGPPPHVRPPWEGRTVAPPPPLPRAPDPATRPGTDPRARQGAARGASPGSGSAPAAARRGLPPLAGLSFAGRAVGPRETKEPPPLPPAPASLRTPPQARRARLPLARPRVRAPAARSP